MRLLCVTGPEIQMPEFASTNSRWKGEITLLKFETTVVSNFIGRGDPCTPWKKRCGASRPFELLEQEQREWILFANPFSLHDCSFLSAAAIAPPFPSGRNHGSISRMGSIVASVMTIRRACGFAVYCAACRRANGRGDAG